MTDSPRLTQYSHGAGCGCKIAPDVLDQLLRSDFRPAPDPALVVGNATRDDAAVYDLGQGEGIISTTDFFMPIVDDPEDFGRIAAANAISDVYAMGGTPLMAIAILGWPTALLGPEVAARVVDGGRKACAEAGIQIAGGHSIDAPEPIFGLAVTGRVALDRLKRNDGALAGSRLYLTKPLGVGILTTAEKRGLLEGEHQGVARDSMCRLNSLGSRLGGLQGVTAMTDVTGFGLLGHLLEICEASGLDARLDYAAVPRIPGVETYLEAGCQPGGTERNYASCASRVSPLNTLERGLLCDPQTSGGLLVAVAPEAENEFLALAREEGLDLSPLGELLAPGPGPRIQVLGS